MNIHICVENIDNFVGFFNNILLEEFVEILSDVQLLIIPYLSISILVQLRYNQSVLIEFKILFI